MNAKIIEEVTSEISGYLKHESMEIVYGASDYTGVTHIWTNGDSEDLINHFSIPTCVLCMFGEGASKVIFNDTPFGVLGFEFAEGDSDYWSITTLGKEDDEIVPQGNSILLPKDFLFDLGQKVKNNYTYTDLDVSRIESADVEFLQCI
jgi:hypothetical protein